MSGAQSILRAIQLLKYFDDDNPTWDLAALTDTSGLNKTTVFRIIGALESEGLIERTTSGAYRLGSEMIALGGRAARANDLRRVANTHLTTLTETTGETTTLEVMRQDGDQGWSMLVIDEVLGKHLVGITQYIGSRLPVYATSTGKAVLAFTPSAADYLDDELRTPVNPHLISRQIFLQSLADVRQDGYALALGELEPGLVAIGAPVFDADGDVQAAISLVGPSVRIDEAKAHALATEVHETATRISYQIGYRVSVPLKA
ncbi:MAG: IclR family transcriptional regulator [Chloroflexota bacterium]